MMVDDIKKMIAAHLPDAFIEVTGDDGVHFDATVVSDIFTAKSLVERQKMVYSALGDSFANGTIHALGLKTYTQDEWSDVCGN